MRTEYDVIYLGASCFAMGCAARAPEGSLILEAGEGLGPEFVDALYAGKTPITRPEGEGAAFFDELAARGILTAESAARGEVHVPAINLVLNRLALAHGLNMLFHVRPISIARDGDTVSVQAVCNAKLYTFTCRCVVDTRSTFAQVKAHDPAAACALRGNLYVPEGATAEGGWDAVTLHKGFLPGEAFLAVPVTGIAPQDMLEAVLRAFEARPAAYLDLRLLTVAHACAVASAGIRQRTETGWYIPGCGFDNPVQAWAAGLAETEVFA